MSAIGGFLQTA